MNHNYTKAHNPIYLSMVLFCPVSVWLVLPSLVPLSTPPPYPPGDSLQRWRWASQPGCQLLAWPEMCFKCCCRLVMRCAACQAAGLLKQMGESVVKKQAFAWAWARTQSTTQSSGTARRLWPEIRPPPLPFPMKIFSQKLYVATYFVLQSPFTMYLYV